MFEIIIGIAAAACTITALAAMWCIFDQAGQKGWKILIPLYGTYTLYKITKNTRFIWYNLGLFLFFIVGSVVLGFFDAGLNLSEQTTDTFLKLLFLPFLVGCAVFSIKMKIALAKCYNMTKIAFLLGLIFLPEILISSTELLESFVYGDNNLPIAVWIMKALGVLGICSYYIKLGLSKSLTFTPTN